MTKQLGYEFRIILCFYYFSCIDRRDSEENELIIFGRERIRACNKESGTKANGYSITNGFFERSLYKSLISSLVF